MPAREFICEDCKSSVFSWGGLEDAERCHGCDLIREMKADVPKLTEESELKLRELLGCMLPKEGEDALREPD